MSTTKTAPAAKLRIPVSGMTHSYMIEITDHHESWRPAKVSIYRVQKNRNKMPKKL